MASVILPGLFGSSNVSSTPAPTGPSPEELARQEEEQRQQEEAAREAEAAEREAEEKRKAEERLLQGRQATILTGASGLSESASVGKASLKSTLG